MKRLALNITIAFASSGISPRNLSKIFHLRPQPKADLILKLIPALSASPGSHNSLPKDRVLLNRETRHTEPVCRYNGY